MRMFCPWEERCWLSVLPCLSATRWRFFAAAITHQCKKWRNRDHGANAGSPNLDLSQKVGGASLLQYNVHFGSDTYDTYNTSENDPQPGLFLSDFSTPKGCVLE